MTAIGFVTVGIAVAAVVARVASLVIIAAKEQHNLRA